MAILRTRLGLVGHQIGHYRILDKLGGGGMGVVYQAHDPRLDRTVALKFLPRHSHADEEATTRFRHEAQAASALDHANICTIHDIGETDEGRLFIAMAYYQGETLKRKIERGALAKEEALDYALQVARGLEKAHSAGAVELGHRTRTRRVGSGVESGTSAPRARRGRVILASTVSVILEIRSRGE